MGFIKEFKTFAMKGNVVDLAVGVIIGAAFGKVVSSLVDNVLMPPLGILINGVNFSDLKIVIQSAANGTPEVAIGYGIFVQNVINFLIVAWALFIVIKAMNRLAAKPQAAPPEDILLLRQIRDALNK